MTATDRRNGLIGSAAIKTPCRAATTGAITLSGEQTIDGVACVSGDRVLVKNQTSGVDNGIWNCSTGSWTRSSDFDGTYDIVTGTIVTVNVGTANTNTLWRISTTGALTIGTTSLTFVQNMASSADSSAISFTPSGTGAVATTAQAKLRESVSVFDFMTTAQIADVQSRTKTLDIMPTIIVALATFTNGGHLHFPAGAYRVHRGTGSLLADNIIAGNLTISGDGAATEFYGLNGAGALPNNVGNEFYNVFQATSVNNITLRDMAFTGYCTPLSLFSCGGNIVVDNIQDNGLLANAGTYLRDKTCYFHKCSDVKVTKSDFNNSQFGVYLSGDSGTRTAKATVSGNTFRQTAAAGAFTCLFPVGVYVYYADDVVVTSNVFEDIYSSLDNGTTGTGIGYGVYESDGASNAVTLSANTFRYNGKGSKRAIGAYINYALLFTATGNTIYAPSSGALNDGIRSDIKITNAKRTITGNSMSLGATTFGVYITDDSTSGFLSKATVSGNTIYGGANAIRVEAPNCGVTIANNTCHGQLEAALFLAGAAANPLKFPLIQGNLVSGGQTNAILFNQYVVSPAIIGNVLLDGNLGNTAGDNGAAILFASLSHGLFLAGNVIGNTAAGGGLFTYGVQNASNAADRIFKDITYGNTFLGLANNLQLGRYSAASPTNGFFDITKGDFIQNVQLNAGGIPGWYCALKLTPTLTVNASSASTTVTVNSTSSMAAGQVVLLTRNASPYDADYYTATKWHVDTIDSVTSGTDFVLTTGIPAGDGTFEAGTAAVVVASFKAAAVIAS